jgi:hypothetical protein
MSGRDKRPLPVAINVTDKIPGKIIGTVNVFRDITKEISVERSLEEFASLATLHCGRPSLLLKAIRSCWLIRSCVYFRRAQ